jgi:DNA-binding transcriptional LysR family regulator
MELEALRTLALVAQHGSFAAAARALNLDPSSVSRIVANAEAALGLRLFQRTTRSLRITEEGETYLRRVVPLIDEFELAREEASRTRAAPSGTLRLTASVAFAHECIVPHLSDFHRRYPEVSLELLPTDATLDILANGIDLAIRLAPAPEGDLVSTRLLDTRYRVCAAPAYLAGQPSITNPVQLAGLNCLRFALPEFRSRWIFRRPGAEPFEVAVSGRTVIANALSLRQAARDGLGPALLADWLIGEDLVRGDLVDLFPGLDCTATVFDTAAWALYPSRAFLPRKVRVAIDFLREKLGRGQFREIPSKR